ncbi:hypothetical protein LTR86_002671 [Recurvomyces mirabilis]|nr:hypothetical protein LTR86_002671 [Recurvomyces mirabilis]
MESAKQILARKVTPASMSGLFCGMILTESATRRSNKGAGYDVLATVELCELILKHISLRDLLKVPLVCRDFCATIRDSSKLQQLLFLKPRVFRARKPEPVASQILTTDGRYLDFEFQHGEPSGSKSAPEIVYQHNPLLLHLDPGSQQLNLQQQHVWEEHNDSRDYDAGARFVLTTTSEHLLSKTYSSTVRRMYILQPPPTKIKLLLLRNDSRNSRWRNWHVVTHELTNDFGVTFGQVVDEFRQLDAEFIEPGVVKQSQDLIFCYVVLPEDDMVEAEE